MPAFAFGLFLACCLLVWAPGLLPAWYLVGFGLALLFALFLPRPGLFLAGLCLGVVLAAIQITTTLAEREHVLSLEQASLTGTIVGMVYSEGELSRFDFLPDSDAMGAARIRVRWDGAVPAPVSGERWTLPLRFHPPAGPPVPGGFDRARWMFRHGVAATASVSREGTALRLESAPPGLHRLRARLSRDLDELLGGREAAALLRGVTVGDRSGFSDQQWTVLNATGTTHLVAISGLHIGMVGGLVMLLCRAPARRLPGRLPAELLAAAAGLLAALLYAALAGFALPTQRALVMFACLVGLWLLRRRTDVATGLSMAAAVVLILDPLAVMDPGFYLSFALVGLVLAVVAAGDRPGRVEAFVRIQWMTGLAIVPVLMLLFGQGPLAGPLANAIAVPVFSLLVVPLALLGTVLMALGAGLLASGLLELAAGALDRLWWLLTAFAELPALSSRDAVAGWLLALSLLAPLSLLLPGPLLPRLVLLLALVPSLAGTPPARDQPLEYWALGDSGHFWRIRAGEETVLWLDAPRHALSPAFRGWLSAQAGREDVVLVINAREGTGPGTLAPVLDGYRTGQLFLPRATRAGVATARHCRDVSLNGLWLSLDEEGSGCRLEWPLPQGHLSLQAGSLRFLDEAGKAQWCLAAEEWSRLGRLQPGEGETPRMRTPRGFWWQASEAEISVPPSNQVSCPV